ncbi:hypothetical protein U1Q18_009855, partial [Sarracenia purpurea var. burkii]
ALLKVMEFEKIALEVLDFVSLTGSGLGSTSFEQMISRGHPWCIFGKRLEAMDFILM